MKEKATLAALIAALTGAGGSAALWRKLDAIEQRLYQLETRIAVNETVVQERTVRARSEP